MIINGVYYTEPELAAKFRQMQETIDRYETENRKLTEEKEELGGAYNDASLGIGYLEQRCEELEARAKEYKRLLLLACADIHFIAETFNTECGSMACSECPFAAEKCTQWVHEKEALDLIGEEP
jgi:chromosome segregation ATPase